MTVALNGAEDGVKRLSGAVFRRRIARLAESGNLAWSAAAFIISLIVLLPIIDLYRVFGRAAIPGHISSPTCFRVRCAARSG